MDLSEIKIKYDSLRKKGFIPVGSSFIDDMEWLIEQVENLRYEKGVWMQKEIDLKAKNSYWIGEYRDLADEYFEYKQKHEIGKRDPDRDPQLGFKEDKFA